MHILQTFVLFFLTLSVALLCGYGIVSLLLPKEYEEHRVSISIPFGYTFFGWTTYVLSGNFNISLPNAAWISFIVSALLSLYSMFFLKLDSRSVFVQKLKTTAWISLPMVVIILWPLFYSGSDTFIAANNPDWFASFIDNFFLRENSVRAQSLHSTDSYAIIQSMAGHMPPSARFSSGFFAIFIEQLFHITQRNALSLSVALFMFSLPQSVYFMCRVAFQLSKRTSVIASSLIGLSAATSMSFVYYYVGQNSGLGILPMVLTIGWIMVMTPTIRTVIMAAIAAGSFIVMYFGMLPYALAPVGFVGAYRLIRGKYSIKDLMLIFFGIPAVLMIAFAGMLGYMKSMFLGWTNIVGQTLQGQYFLDFLSEHFFVILYGITSYPISNSFQFAWLADMGFRPYPILFTLAALLSVFVMVMCFVWVKDTWKKSPETVILGLSGFIIYGLVWHVYTFDRQYGYAVFKMSAWLQFFVVLPFAYGFEKWSTLRRSSVASVMLAVVLVFYVGSNVISTQRYSTFSLGQNNVEAKMINNYGFTANRDYLELVDNVKKYVKPTESIGLSFTDSILNFWAAYYLRDYKLSMHSHLNMPGDDENLPDMATRRVVDYYGNVRLDRNQFFHGAKDDFYLTMSPTNLNQDIMVQKYPKPLWENKTFRLYKASDTKDFVFTGRGWYRLEYTRPNQYGFWMPEAFRFTAEGGEVFLIAPSKPKSPYQMQFTAFVGYGTRTAERHIELWNNGKKFDDVLIENGMAKIVSKPFYPDSDTNLLVIRVMERVHQLEREIPLWNKSVPLDYRKANVAVSNLSVLPVESLLNNNSITENRIVNDQIIEKSLSFNGIFHGRWMGKDAKLVFERPKNAKRVELRLGFEALDNLTFPFTVKIKQGSNTKTVDVKEPGFQNVMMDLSSPNEKLVSFEIQSSKASETLFGISKISSPVIERTGRIDHVQFF